MFPFFTILLQLLFHTSTSKFPTCLPKAFCFLGTLLAKILSVIPTSLNKPTVQTADLLQLDSRKKMLQKCQLTLELKLIHVNQGIALNYLTPSPLPLSHVILTPSIFSHFPCSLVYASDQSLLFALTPPLPVYQNYISPMFTIPFRFHLSSVHYPSVASLFW